jgi:16S rRNA (cytosine967-C5)-methyltransferase
MKPFILNVLRAAVYELRFTNSAKGYAVCSEAVEICKARGFGKLSGFVNAVLRNIQRAAQAGERFLPEDGPERLSVEFSTPRWIVDIFEKTYGAEGARDLLRSLSERPRVCVCPNAARITKAGLAEVLSAEGVTAEDFYPEREDCLIIRETSDISELRAYKDGLFHVASASALASLDPLSGRTPENALILDACAAPGGKSFALAGKFPGASITAADIYPRKVGLIRDGAERLGLSAAISAETADMTKFAPAFEKKFDIVIADCPCTGLGLLRKKPDIKFSRAPGDIETLARLQREIAENCVKYVKPGGLFLYITCTLNPAENADNAGFIESLGGAPLEAREILPRELDSDGFFTALFGF